MPFNRSLVRNTRGATLALIALSMMVVLAMAALAIDLGMLIKTRAEAQRTADAAALAGASAFQNGPIAVSMVQPAIAQALRLAANNYVDGKYVDTTGQTQLVTGPSTFAYTSEATVEVRPDIPLVRVTIRRPNVRTWFAQTLGITLVPVLGRAAAIAAESGSVNCIKPFAIPDMWQEDSAVRAGPPTRETGDSNGSGEWESGERWAFDPVPGGDRYEAVQVGVASSTATGYGSHFRDLAPSGLTQDYGRQLIIKASDPKDAIGPGFFYPFQIDGTQGGGGNVYQNDIETCNPLTVETGTPYPVEPGNMQGPTRHGVDNLIAQDSAATWDPFTETIINSRHSNWRASERVIIVGLFDPTQTVGWPLPQGQTHSITFNNFALVFLEGFTGTAMSDPLIARFLFFANGAGPPGGGPAPLVRKLQLVE